MPFLARVLKDCAQGKRWENRNLNIAKCQRRDFFSVRSFALFGSCPLSVSSVINGSRVGLFQLICYFLLLSGLNASSLCSQQSTTFVLYPTTSVIPPSGFHMDLQFGYLYGSSFDTLSQRATQIDLLCFFKLCLH